MGFPLDFLTSRMSTFPGGSHLVMRCDSGGTTKYAIGYKYSSKKVLTFIASAGTGTTLPGKEYEGRWTDKHGNVHSRKVPRPRVISTYFDKNNVIDSHNHVCQHELRLEKFWITTDPYFRLSTTLFGIGVVDCWKALRFHLHDKHRYKNQSIR